VAGAGGDLREGLSKTFFFEKRTKKLFPLEPSRAPVAHTKRQKVFASFFKKKRVLPYAR
jgi:hypothetical protein